ncbi:MAG: hypothetical protein A2020_12855 [Lentisphaerae bacterium GWF2_45_14]|nr:MAG: hypothetical protein A2020_12855 [Lentisphaerae bacterium GWF2_45_14]
MKKLKIWTEGRYLDDIDSLLKKAGFTFCAKNPDLIITHGGDGAMLGAERKYPGISKFPMRDSRTAALCPLHSYEKQIAMLNSGLLEKSELIKIAGFYGKKSIVGINDVFIHNREHVSALRYNVWIDGELYADDIVGDGVGVSTVHGSTAYYRSITHSVFRVGIGLAFSNSTELTNHLVLPEDSEVKIQITRGPAVLVADNSPEYFELGEKDEITVRKINKKAEILGLDIFMCPACRILRHPKSRPFYIRAKK